MSIRAWIITFVIALTAAVTLSSVVETAILDRDEAASEGMAE